jgi:hypothetical protein
MFDDSDDITKNRHGGNANSVEAHGKLDKCKKLEMVYQCLKTFGKYGATSEQVAERLSWPINQVSGRFTELKKFGKATKAFLPGRTKMGNAADILIAV